MAENKKAPSQEEIINEVNRVSTSNWNPNDKPDMVDPIIYRQDYKTEDIINGRDPKKLANGGVNKDKYGDDGNGIDNSNAVIPNLYGGTNGKYMGEGVSNSYEAYDPNLTTDKLDPTYKYGLDAEMANSEQANYIARRNDNIATALYNEGKTSIEDVANFLNAQEGFRNSYEEERQNTITSIWKRIGQKAQENQKSDVENADPNNTPLDGNTDAENSQKALENMESDLNKSTAGELYGKVTADQSTGIQTLEDQNSVYKAMNEARIRAVSNLQAMDSQAIASAIISGSMASDSQAMRDLMQYDNAKYQYVQQAVKQIRGQMNINAITSGEGDYNTVATNGQSGINNEIANFAADNANMNMSTADILNSVNDSLKSNQNFNSAEETKANIAHNINSLQDRLKNLKNEANTVFKGDVPQYIVNAYIANRTAEIQDQLSILENDYKYAQSRADTEWSRAMDMLNYSIKLDELQLKKDAADLNDWATRQGIAIDWYKAKKGNSNSSSTTINGNTVQTTSLSREEINTSIDYLVQKCKDGQLGNAQCAAGIQKYYLPTLGVDLGSLSTYSAKQGICNQLAGEYTPQKGDVVVMSSPTKPENGHMGIVVGIDGDTITYLDWNGELKDGVGTETAGLHTAKLSNSKIYGYYNPTKGNSILQYEGKWTTRYGKEYDFSQYSEWNGLSAEEKEIVKGILEYRIDPTSLAKSGTDNGKANTRIRAAALAIGGQDFDYQEDEYKHRYDLVKKWNNATQAGGELSRNATAADELMRLYNIYHKYDKAHTNFRPRNSFTAAYSNVLGMSATEEFNAALQVAASELAGALKGNASPSEQELKEYKNALQFSLSEEQFDSKVKEYLHGINNKMASEAQYYEKITGKKPQNIYNQYEGLPQFVSDIAGIDLANYFSDTPSTVGNTKRDVTPSKGNTNRGTTEQNAQQKSAADKAKALQGF